MSSSGTSRSAGSVGDEASNYRGQSSLVSVLVGAVAAVVASVVLGPLAAIVGGAVAAYLFGGDRSDGLRVGGYAGAVSAVPLVGLAGLVVVGVGLFGVVGAAAGMGMGMGMAPGTGMGFGLAGFLLVLVVVLLVGLVVSAGLGALGGYLTAVILEE